MGALQNIRRGNLNKFAIKTAKSGARGLSSVNSALLEAVRVSCKCYKNTDGDVDTELLTKLQSDLDSIASGLPACLTILDDLIALRADPLTVDAVITKYNVDLTAFNADLEQS